MSDEILIDCQPHPPPSPWQGREPLEVRRIVARARKLRRNATDVERKLWHRIRDKQIDEFRFRRQRPIGKYIVDFICLDAKLIVELDGGKHAEDSAYDQRRTAFLESLGYRVLRFWNNEVIESMDGVLQRLHENLLCSRANPTLTLHLAGEGADRASTSIVANTLPPDGANADIIADTPSLAQRGKAGMGVPRKNAANKNATKDKK